MGAIVEGKQENKTDLSRKRPPDFLRPNICGFPQVQLHIHRCDKHISHIPNNVYDARFAVLTFMIVKKLSHVIGKAKAFKLPTKCCQRKEKNEEQKVEWISQTSALADFPRRLLRCSDEQKIFQIFARSGEFPPCRDRCV